MRRKRPLRYVIAQPPLTAPTKQSAPPKQEEIMPDDKEKQYSIRLSMTVEKDGEVFNSNEIEWKQLRYDGAVLIQKVMLDALNALNDAGIENAKRKGQGAMFEAQG